MTINIDSYTPPPKTVAMKPLPFIATVKKTVSANNKRATL